MVPPEVHQALKVNQTASIEGDKVDIFQCGVLMFMARFRHLPFVEASMEDPNYRLLFLAGTGTFRNEIPEYLTDKIRNGQNPEKEEAFLSLLLQMMHPNPEERPSMKVLLARPIWQLWITDNLSDWSSAHAILYMSSMTLLMHHINLYNNHCGLDI